MYESFTKVVVIQDLDGYLVALVEFSAILDGLFHKCCYIMILKKGMEGEGWAKDRLQIRQR